MQTPVQTFNRATLILLGLGLAVWLGWRLAYPTYAWHQKITITVETPSGDVSGSSVSAMTVWTAPKILQDAPDIGFAVVAEAPVLEIAPGRYLFALISNAPGWASDTFAPQSVETDFRKRMRMIERQRGNPAKDMPPAAWPRLVTFGDVADPTTVRLVDADDLDAAFGCPATDGVAMPWRQAGLTYRQWVTAEDERLAHAGAAANAGITGAAAAALEARFRLAEARRPLTDAERARLEELDSQVSKSYTAEQFMSWQNARAKLRGQFTASAPPARIWTSANGGPCHSLKAMTLQITREPVTLGRVEAVLGWLKAQGHIGTLKGAPPGGFVPGEISPPEYLIDSSDFSTELYK